MPKVASSSSSINPLISAVFSSPEEEGVAGQSGPGRSERGGGGSGSCCRAETRHRSLLRENRLRSRSESELHPAHWEIETLFKITRCVCMYIQNSEFKILNNWTINRLLSEKMLLCYVKMHFISYCLNKNNLILYKSNISGNAGLLLEAKCFF